MKIYLDPKKSYYKANLHSHSRYSDGRASREDIKREYKARGYSAVAFTDHEHTIDPSALTDEDFIAICGCELAVGGGPVVDPESPTPSGKVVHMCMYAKDPANHLTPCYSEKQDSYKFEDVRHLVVKDGDYTREYSPECINEMIRIAHEKGFLVSYNHASWSLEDASDYLAYDGFDFVEVHNTACVVMGHPNEEYVYTNMLRAGKRVYCTAADDNHNACGFDGDRTDSFGGWVMINAEKLGYKELIDALEAGDFYASTGPEIYSLTVDDDLTVKVTFSEARRAVIITQGRRVASTFDVKDGSASFKLTPRDISFRIRVDDAHGHSAYTQLYEIPEDIREKVAIKAAEAEAKAAAEKAASK
jgi:hypothetical protein